MNTDTGAIYRTQEAIEAAQLRGEPLVMVSERVARLMNAGRRAEAKVAAKQRRKMAKQSRRANRR